MLRSNSVNFFNGVVTFPPEIENGKVAKRNSLDSSGSASADPEVSNDETNNKQTSYIRGSFSKNITKAVTENTTKHLAAATEQTTKQIGSAIKQSEEAYEKSQWCFLARFIGQFPKYFPRVFSFTFGVLVPLWLLILISAGFGTVLVHYEATEERISNFEILKSRARINRTFVERTDIGRLPVDCFVQYLNQSNMSLFAERINLYLLASSTLEDLNNITGTNMTDSFNGTEVIQGSPNIFNSSTANLTDGFFPSFTNYTLGDVLMDTQEDILLYMTDCQANETTDIETFLEDEAKYGETSASSLSFNWNRCWPKEINEEWGSTNFVFFPPRDLIEASHPLQQAATLETEFVRILTLSEKECFFDGGEDTECFEQALEDAFSSTGDICRDNLEGTSWFFFTIMTTVGYGNQAPITDEGRLLIYFAGIACLILFAAVLGSSGYIILSIFDDFVGRFWVSYFLQYPLVGVLLWGGIWIGWAYAIATDADTWWAERLPDFDVDRDDALWFAFISTSTIGLGDYFLHPAVMFASDALKFSAEFLIGFVFLSTFLNKIGEFIFSIVPQRDNSLETRLKETNIFFWKHWPCIDYLKSDYLRSIAYDEHSDENCEITVDKQQQTQEQIRRVEVVKSLLPNQSLPPPLNTMYADKEKTIDDLLDEEELILKVLLESIPQRRIEMHNATRVRSPAVKTMHLMTGLGPRPDSFLSDRSDNADDVLSASRI